MTVAIRRCAATQADGAMLAALHALCFTDAWDAHAFTDLLATPGTAALLAQMPDPVGLVMFRCAADEAEILTLGVVPHARGRGVARALVDQLCRVLAQTAVHSLFLEVAADNAAAHRLYAGAGFTKVGSRAKYYARPGATAMDADILKRALPGDPALSKS